MRNDEGPGPLTPASAAGADETAPHFRRGALRHGALTLALLWLLGVNLRTVLLSVPPALPELHKSLGLSYSAAGLLTALPVLVMALGAVPGALLISQIGARNSVSLGLALVTVGAALRGARPSALSLFAFTVVLAVGVAVAQPTVPSLVQAWFPRQIGRAAAVYSNGLLVGETAGATATLPLLLTLPQLGWQGALAAWALPAMLGLVLWALMTPASNGRVPGAAGAWLPDVRSGRTWRLGFLMGGASLIYFGMNTWIPDTLEVRGGRDLIPLTLGLLNAMQLPVSAALAVVGDALLGRRWPYVLAGVASVLGIAGYALGPTVSAPIWAGMLGAASSLVFILNLGLPALLQPGEVARVTGFMLALGYATAFFGPAVGGQAWDRTGQPILALAPVAAAALAVIALGGTLPRFGDLRPAQAAASRPA